MNLLKRRMLGLLLIIVTLFLLSGCEKAKKPVEIIELNVFRIQHYGDAIGIYIGWKNTSAGKVIDALTLSVYSDLEESPFECQIFEPDGIMPGSCNHHQLFYIDNYEVSLIEAKELSFVISKVCFTDGSRWEESAKEQSVRIEIDGHRGEGEFPIKLSTAFFYEDDETPNSYMFTRFLAEWKNISTENNILEVVYKVVARSIDRKVICDENGNDAIYFSRSFSSPGAVPVSYLYMDEHYFNGPTAYLLREKKR